MEDRELQEVIALQRCPAHSAAQMSGSRATKAPNPTQKPVRAHRLLLGSRGG